MRHPLVVLYADPPWSYEFNTTDSLRGIENQYPTLDDEAIAALPVAALVGSRAVLYLWTTAPRLDTGMRVLGAWGFDYVTMRVWDKRARAMQGDLFPDLDLGHRGIGHWHFVDHEILLIGRRGKVSPPPDETLRSSVYNIAKGRHSRKPEAVREHIEQSHPDAGRRIELFARPPLAEGWECYGNEVDRRDIREALAFAMAS